jgi:hypothetical protein
MVVLQERLMLEWVKAPKKRTILEVTLLPSRQQDEVITVLYSQLIYSRRADQGSPGAVILIFREISIALIVRAEVRHYLEKLIHSHRIQRVSGSRDREVIVEVIVDASGWKKREYREALRCDIADRMERLVDEPEIQDELDNALEQVTRMRTELRG